MRLPVACFHRAERGAAVSAAGGGAGMPCVHWLGGWGLAQQDMLAIAQELLPQARHRVWTPGAASLNALCSQLETDSGIACGESASGAFGGREPVNGDSASGGGTVILAGYSTGAFLLLRELHRLMPLLVRGLPLLLFAPFVDFRAESDLGGRVVTTRLKLLLRRLRVAPLAAVADFYHQSNIALPAPQALPYASADLIWGIEQLAQTAVSAENLATLRNAAGLDIRAWVGAADALLDAQKIASLFAAGVCRIEQNASHDFGSLLKAAIAEGGLW